MTTKTLSSYVPGFARASPGGTELFLRADSTWARPVHYSTHTLGEIKVNLAAQGGVIATGIRPQYYRASLAGTVTGWQLVGDVAGNIVIDVVKAPGTLPMAGHSMTGGNGRPTLSFATVGGSTDMSAWTTTTVSVGDVLAVNVISASLFQNVTLTLRLSYAL